jgi:hypothetical protein
MTWVPDHRATHGPDTVCDGCRPPDTAARASVVAPAPDARGFGALRPDLVIQPGSNRK